MTTLLSTVFVLGVLVFVHELGHFLLAKVFKIRVERFSIGYPPRMVGKQIGDTDYCLSWVPFGGYVKISGMVDESMDTEALAAEPKPWEFRARPLIQRMLVIFGGPAMNIVFAVWLIWMLLTISGFDFYNAHAVVGEVAADMPAAEAGLMPGDSIVAVNEQAVDSWNSMTTLIRGSGGETIALNVFRSDSLFSLMITPRVSQVSDSSGTSHPVPQIGITPQRVHYKMGVGKGFNQALVASVGISKEIFTTVQKLVSGRESIKNLAGPVGIAQMAGQTAKNGFSDLIGFMAMLSLNLAILNLLPIPVLDGGHLMFLIIEGIIRRELPLKVKLIIQQVGMALLLFFMILVIYNDVLRIFK